MDLRTAWNNGCEKGTYEIKRGKKRLESFLSGALLNGYLSIIASMELTGVKRATLNTKQSAIKSLDVKEEMYVHFYVFPIEECVC